MTSQILKSSMPEEVSVMEGELVLVHSNLIHSVLEYAFPLWANLLGIVSSYLRMCIKKALEIIIPGLPQRDALVHCGLCTFSNRRAAVCAKFIQRVRDTGVLANLLPQLYNMDTIYVQAPSERIPSWFLITFWTILLHILDIPSKMFHVHEHTISALTTL